MTSVGLCMWCVSHLIPNSPNWCAITWRLNEEKWHSISGSTCYFRSPSFSTRNMLTMDRAYTLWKPHTEQLVNQPESQFYLNAYETSEETSKTSFYFFKSQLKVKYHLPSATSWGCRGQNSALCFFLHLGSQPFLLVFIYQKATRAYVCIQVDSKTLNRFI